MSIKYNGKTVAGNYKIKLSNEASTTEEGLIRIATDEEAKAGELTNVAVTPEQLSKYGGGGSSGGGGTNTLVDDVTIVKDEDTDIITTIGVRTKNEKYLYDWIGTKAEYNQAIANGEISADEDCICWITDDSGSGGGGSVSVDIATTETAGIVKPDGTTITITEDGTISAIGGGGGSSAVVETDNKTITLNGEDKIQVVGSYTVNSQFKNEFVGTREEYEQALAEGLITEDTVCTITDDTQDVVVPIATTETAGIVKPDGETITVDNSGVISAVVPDVLNNKITNCLLEVPQRIKYTLEDGTLTIKAGSVVIVPYGTEIVGNSSDEPEIVGTLTVDAEGGYSGFSYPNVFGDSTPENYILAPILDKADYSKVEYLFKFKMGEEGGGLISSSDSTETLVLSVDPSGLTFMDGMVQFFHSSETPIFISGNTYWVKVLTQNGQRTTVFVSNDGKTYNELVDDYYDPEYDYSEDTSVAFLDGVQNIIGVYVSMGSFHLPFDGTLYVKESYIKIDDEPFWSFEPPTIRNLAEECPIGSKFLNDNFIVVGTQQADGKFFVWAEIQNDISYYNVSGVDAQRHLTVCIEQNTLASPIYTVSSTSSTVANKFTLNYRTDLNKVHHQTEKESADFTTCSLVLIIGTSVTGQSVWTTVDQVFNGFGYIGSTIWVDKGVKGLIPNGRNEDGTLRNVDITTNKLATNNVPNDAAKYCGVNCLGVPYFADQTYYYNKIENRNVQNNLNWDTFVIAELSVTNGQITSFNPKQPIRVADLQDVVKKSGDTMTGTLNVVTDSNGVKLTSNVITLGETPTAHRYANYKICDKNDTFLSEFYYRQGSSGDVYIGMCCRNQANSASQYCLLGYTAEGNPMFQFPKCTTKATTTSSANNNLVAVITQNYVSGTSWYRVWSDGWKEQGGTIQKSADTMTVTLLKAFSNTNYTVHVSLANLTGNFYATMVNTRAKGSFQINNGHNNSVKYDWYACGY